MLSDLNPAGQICALCGSNRLKRFDALASDVERQEDVHIVECRECGFAWQFPFSRSEKESVDHFEANYDAGGNRISKYFDPSVKEKISKLQFEFLASLPLKGRRLLDVGGGAGIFARIAAQGGFDVTALDPALKLDTSDQNHDVTFIKGTLDDLPDGKAFDVITLWDVIEHLTEPRSLIENVKGRLRDDGWLVIETGNYLSADRVQSGRKHWIYQLDHRWYFSPRSIESVLREAGFREFVYADRVLRPGWSGGAEYSGPSIGMCVRELISHPWRSPECISRFAALRRAVSWSRSGLGIFVVAARA